MESNDRIGRRIKLHDLHILTAVVQAGSMSKAAAVLNATQSTISRSIAELEKTIGVRLLDRTAQGVEPTHYGHALLVRGIAAFDEIKQGIGDIRNLADPGTGELRIGSPVAIAAGFVVAVVERFSRRYPAVVFELLAEDADSMSRLLEERRVDVVLTRMFRPDVPENMHAQILYDDEPFVVAAGIQSPWTKRRKLKLADLAKEAWVLPPPHSSFGSVVSDAFRASGLNVPRAAIITSAVPVRNALLGSGRFLTILPGSLLQFPSKSRILQGLPIKLPIAPRPIAAITLRNRTLSPLVKLFIDCACEVAKPTARITTRTI
jgi:DNA-binding transcriptional LysR family regulator